ncbi:MAG: ATP synthase F1 subunit delta, partial [Eubacterium sp.]
MIENTKKYLDSLLSSQASVSSLEDALKTISSSAQLVEILSDPSVSVQEKELVCADLFAPSVKDFIVNLSVDGKIGALSQITEEYIALLNKKNNIASATVYCVTEPDEKQLEGIKAFVCKEENACDADIKIVKDDTLIGGFIIRVGDREYDRSLKSRLASIKKQVMETARDSSVNQDNVLAVLRRDIKDFENKNDSEEVGTVIRVGDNIAAIHGLNHAMYGEIVVFENGVKGMVQ